MTPIRSLRTAHAVLFLLVCGAAMASGREPIALTIHADRPGAKISPLLYGIFFEEINRAGDGGIYGEMIQNRSFEDDRGPRNAAPKRIPAWTLLRSEGAEARIALDDSRPVNPKNPYSLRLEIVKTGGGRAAVANEGFRGIAVQQGRQYNLSLYARGGNGFHGPLEVSVEDKDGKILASARIEAVGPDWEKFHRVLTAERTTASARLVVAVSSPGTVWLDMVSLFPNETWKGRPNGLRPDVAEMLAEMKPAFVRFPGGCYVEGDRLPNAFRWKNTIGDVAARPGHWNLWGYRSTDGLGYHEYLQMCEDLGAEPLFVINCGMSHEQQEEQGRTKRAADVPDLAEYVAGRLGRHRVRQRAGGRASGVRCGRRPATPPPSTSSTWKSATRTAAPPTISTTSCSTTRSRRSIPKCDWWPTAGRRPGPVEILDEHYYSSPEFFMDRAAQYDKYDRKGPKIYVGEYAVTENCGRGNLRAALGEAAFMTGMERNADVVVMASYAPLFVNVGWRQWNPDAIQYDNRRVCGTPSYYVQKMFSRARGDVVLGMDFDIVR